MSEVEYAGLVLEDQLLDHLATPEGATAIWKDRFNPDLVENDEGVHDAVTFVMNFMDMHREPPDISVIAEETGYEEFQEPIAPIDYVIDKLKERYQRKQVKQTITKIARLSGEPDEALAVGLSEFNRIRSETLTRRDQFDSDMIIDVLDRYKQSVLEPPGVTFGFEEFDNRFGGLRKGNLYFVVARPKRFKSWMLMKSAVEALLQGKTTTLFTLEMSKEVMSNRFVCMLAGVSWGRFQNRGLMPADIDAIEQASRWAFENEAKLRIVRPPFNERTVPHMVSLAEEHGAEAVYIDQLSWIKPTITVPEDQSWIKIKYICEELKEASDKFPVFCAAQFNREAAGLSEMADLSKIGLGDSVGQVADMVLGLYSTKEMKQAGIFHYGTVDARDYAHGEWEMKCDLGLDSDFRVINDISDTSA